MSSRESDRAADAAALVDRLTAWLDHAGVEGNGVAVDFADVLNAARRVEEILGRLLAVEPRTPAGAEEALAYLGALEAWLFGEMKHHLMELEQAWPRLENRLLELAPPDE